MAMVNYRSLKSSIIKSSVGSKKSNSFVVNYDKLNKLVSELDLVMVNVGTSSSKIEPKDSIAIAEYLKNDKLKWINNSKEYSILLFIAKDAVDEKCNEMLEKLSLPSIENPDIDKANIVATLIADYPCYQALVVSYVSNGPSRFNSLSYEIKIRANTVVIKSEGYGYKHEDMK